MQGTKEQSIQVTSVVTYFALSFKEEERLGIVKQYWSKEAIRFDTGGSTAIVRSDGRLLFVDHSSRRARLLRVPQAPNLLDQTAIATADPDATLSALRTLLRDYGVLLEDRPVRSRSVYLGLPCTVETYHDKQKEPVLTVYRSGLREGPGLLKLVCLVSRQEGAMLYAWDTVSYAKIKLPLSAFEVPAGYIVMD